MNLRLRFCAFALSIVSAASAAPFIAIGEGAELFATGTLGVRFDDNVLLASNPARDGDFIFEAAPGLELTFGRNSLLKGSLACGQSFTRYADHHNLNTDLATADFSARYEDGRSKLALGASYRELNQNNVFARGLIRRDVATGEAGAEVEISPLTVVVAGVTSGREDYRDGGAGTEFFDSKTNTVPLTLYYKWTEKVDVGLGWRFRDQQLNRGGQDSKDHFLHFAARGKFTPKLNGRIAIGYNRRNFERGANEKQLGLDTSLTFDLTPKTGLQLEASNDFNTTPQGVQQRNLALNARVTAHIQADWTASLGVGYRGLDYGTRVDRFFDGQLATSYVVNAHVRLIGSYEYRRLRSHFSALEFANNVVSVAAIFRY